MSLCKEFAAVCVKKKQEGNWRKSTIKNLFSSNLVGFLDGVHAQSLSDAEEREEVLAGLLRSLAALDLRLCYKNLRINYCIYINNTL